MNNDETRFKRMLQLYLNRSKNEIVDSLGNPTRKSDQSVYFYRKISFSLFWEETALIFEEDKVVDIIVNIFFLWWEIRSIYYFEGRNLQYKTVKYI